MNDQATITIGRTKYRVERVERPEVEGADRIGYLLHGARGATYGTLRYLKRPEIMFPVNARSRRFNTPGGPMGAVNLTDKNGILEVY